jgi:hypothetical protein
MGSVRLNNAAYDHAKHFIQNDRYVIDDRDEWSEHQPLSDDENRYIKAHGIQAYAKWHLGIDDSKSSDSKGRYKFPYGDLTNVHRCAVLSAEVRAGQYKYADIKQAAAHLHGMLEAR